MSNVVFIYIYIYILSMEGKISDSGAKQLGTIFNTMGLVGIVTALTSWSQAHTGIDDSALYMLFGVGIVFQYLAFKASNLVRKD